MELKAIELLVHYNDYIELREDLNVIAQKIQNLNVAKKYKINVPQTPIITAGIIPTISIEFCEEERIDYKPFAVLSIDNSVLRFGLKIENTKLDLDIYENKLKELKDLFLKIWDTFNEIAKRKIIERIGLISLTEETSKDFYNQIKSSMINKEIGYEYYSLRFFDVVRENIEPLTNTMVIKNIILDTDLEHKNLNFKTLKLINDIATTPSSSGILDIEKLSEGINKLIKFSTDNMEILLKVVKND